MKEQSAAEYEKSYCQRLYANMQNEGNPFTIFKGYMYPINKENEAAAWMLIYNSVKEALEKYPTTLEQDIQILKED